MQCFIRLTTVHFCHCLQKSSFNLFKNIFPIMQGCFPADTQLREKTWLLTKFSLSSPACFAQGPEVMLLCFRCRVMLINELVYEPHPVCSTQRTRQFYSRLIFHMVNHNLTQHVRDINKRLVIESELCLRLQLDVSVLTVFSYVVFFKLLLIRSLSLLMLL